MVQWFTVGNFVAHEVISIEWPCAPCADSRFAVGELQWAKSTSGRQEQRC